MYIGHMFLNSPSRHDSSPYGWTCPACHSNFAEPASMRSDCDDHFGGHSWWTDVCPECGDEGVYEGKTYLVRSGISRARRNHVCPDTGKVKVRKGKRYRWEIVKGFCIKDGRHEPVLSYWKRELKETE